MSRMSVLCQLRWMRESDVYCRYMQGRCTVAAQKLIYSGRPCTDAKRTYVCHHQNCSVRALATARQCTNYCPCGEVCFQGPGTERLSDRRLLSLRRAIVAFASCIASRLSSVREALVSLCTLLVVSQVSPDARIPHLMDSQQCGRLRAGSSLMMGVLSRREV